MGRSHDHRRPKGSVVGGHHGECGARAYNGGLGAEPPAGSRVELGQYRFLKSVSVFCFLVGFFQKSVSISVFQNIAISVSVFPHEPTIAYRITPSLTPYALPFSLNGVWALEFALQIAAIRDSDIVTIDNL